MAPTEARDANQRRFETQMIAITVDSLLRIITRHEVPLSYPGVAQWTASGYFTQSQLHFSYLAEMELSARVISTFIYRHQPQQL
jgi:hypothetical protein